MTIIVALSHEEGVTVGSDSLLVMGQDVLCTGASKWTINGEGLSVGVSGSPYFMETIGELAATEKTACGFCSVLRNYFRCDERWLPTRSSGEGRPPIWDLNLLLTDGKGVWEVGSSLYPLRHEFGAFIAMGSGYQYAMGAMYAMHQALTLATQRGLSRIPREKHPEIIVEDGLVAAMRYDTCCGGRIFMDRISRRV